MSSNLIWSSITLLMALCLASCGSAGDAENAGGSNAPPISNTPSTASSPCAIASIDATRKIVITSPCDGATVALRHFVEGIVADPNARVWVVIHPMEVADYWVQPAVTVREGGKWKVLCYFGEPGPQHSGKHYEVTALVNPKEALSEGQLYQGWPEAESRSQVIEVVRQ